MRILICFFLGICLSGCASIFASHDGNVTVYGPDSMTARITKGDSIPIVRNVSERYIHPMPEWDSTMIFSYRGSKRLVHLEKDRSHWLAADLLTLFVGDVVDDATGNAFRYKPIDLSFDTSRVDSIVIPRFVSNPFGLNPLKLLVAAGSGIIPSAGGGIGVLSFWEASGGISWQPFDLFYRIDYSIAADVLPDGPNRHAGSVTTQTVDLRYFPLPHWAATLGYGLSDVQPDSVDGQGYIFARGPNSNPSCFVAGVGWYGDFSYLEAREYFGLQDVQIQNQGSSSFRELVLVFGLYTRL